MEKEIENIFKKYGYVKGTKDCLGQRIFEKGNTRFYLGKTVFKKQKEETFQEMTAKMYK